MSKGYVYILENPSMPGLLKIGKTTRSAHQRASELYATGVPTPFTVYDEVLSPNCHELEAWMHNHFGSCRVSQGREFFTCTTFDAGVVLHRYLLEQLRMMVGEFLGNYEIVPSDLVLSEPELCMIAADLDVRSEDAVMAISFLKSEELKPALDRYYARVQLRSEARAAGLEMPPLYVWSEGPVQ